MKRKGETEMLFNKKKNIKNEFWSFQDIEYQKLNQLFCDHRKTLVTECMRVITHEGCANMLPDGADKNIELKKAQEARERIRNVLAAYDQDLKIYNTIDATKFNHYTGKAQWCSSHEMLQAAWAHAIRQIYGA